jgi:hypothetical protein
MSGVFIGCGYMGEGKRGSEEEKGRQEVMRDWQRRRG